MPKGFWNNEKNVEEFVKWVADELHFKNLDDWYSVTTAQVISSPFRRLLIT